MPLLFVRNDITKMHTDAIVNAANPALSGGGGVDGAIHAVAGPELAAACRTLGGCRPGEAKLTAGFRLPAKYVIHTVGPVWRGGLFREKATLEACYKNALRLALEAGCESVAFPLISAGVYGYPKDKALETAVNAIEAFLGEHELLVYLVFFDREAFLLGKKRRREIESLIDDVYVAENGEAPALRRARMNLPREKKSAAFREAAPFGAESAPAPDVLYEDAAVLPQSAPVFSGEAQGYAAVPAPAAAQGPASLEEALGMLDESFSEMLLRKIDEKGITDAACYKRANIDRKLFSKIRSDRLYKPRKTTALAFAVALELPPAETRELLLKAGYALSHSSKFDIIVEYFINSGNYNIFEINEALFSFDQPLLS